MAWRGLHLSRPARLALADRQIVIVQEADEVRLALEDLAWIVIDTNQVTLTAALLSACAEAGIVLVTCDERHTPSALTLPFHSHHKQAAIASLQIAASIPLQKRLWQAIARAKITNQAAVLDERGTGGSVLKAMVHHVESGDPDNVEARAARLYWSRLFRDFVREQASDGRNALLNYGYAVVRAGVARAIVAHGLLPALGVKHRSVTNSFNLADDLVEPFRPFVDRIVYAMATADGAKTEVTLPRRRQLASVLSESAVMPDGTMTLLAATERAAMTLVRAFETRQADRLEMPRLTLA